MKNLGNRNHLKMDKEKLLVLKWQGRLSGKLWSRGGGYAILEGQNRDTLLGFLLFRDPVNKVASGGASAQIR